MLYAKTLFSSLFILALSLTIGACDQAKGYTDQEFVQRAKDFQAQGKLESAVIELKNALQKNPKNPEARLRLGEIYTAMGLGESAQLEFKRAKELGLDDEALKVPMGQALVDQRLYAQTLEQIQVGPNTPPGDIPKILEIRGRAHFGLGHIDDGCALFDQSIEKDPQYVPSYWGLARCAAARGNLDDARTDLNRALKLEEKNSRSWALLGDLEHVANRLPEAEAAYATALKYKSNDLDALLGRAALRIDNNNLTAAGQDVDAATKRSPSHPLVNQLRGVLQFKQGHFDEAKVSFETALKANPNYLPAVLWLGMTNFSQGDYQQAVTQFGRYNREIPDATRAQAMLALAQARLGRGQEGQDTLKALANVDVKDPQSLAMLAQAHLYFGETDIAAAYLTKAIDQKPDEADLRLALAATLTQKGDRAQAIEQLEDAIHLDPALPKADVLLIQNLIREKQFDKAMSAVEVLEKKQPKDATTFNLKGGVYLAMNDRVNARKSFEHALALETNSIAASMNLAQLDLMEEKPDAARQRFQSILAKDTTNVQAMMGLAGVAAATAQETEYVAWLENAAKAAPSTLRPRLLLASYYLNKHNVHRALVLAQEAQIANPTNPLALDMLGATQLAAGEPQNAVATYSKLVGFVPNSPIVYFQLATAQATGQSIGAARASLSKALALKADYLPAELLLASVELDAGRSSEASKIALQIQKQYPAAAAGVTLQGDIFMAQKQYAQALNAYEKALEIDKSGQLAVKVHQALSANGHTGEADVRLLQWLKDNPNDSVARTYLAASYVQLGHNELGIEQYQLLLETDPKNIRALNDLAWLYQQEKDARALPTAEQAYQLNPDSPTILDTLGWILVEQGNVARGLELLQKAATKSPASTAILYHRAVALAKSGDNVRARQELADLLTKNKKFPQRQEAQSLLMQL